MTAPEAPVSRFAETRDFLDQIKTRVGTVAMVAYIVCIIARVSCVRARACVAIVRADAFLDKSVPPTARRARDAKECARVRVK